MHVVGDETFATHIVSTATDYRYAATQAAQRTMAAAQLPDHVADQCRYATRELGLLLAGIDFAGPQTATGIASRSTPHPPSPGFRTTPDNPLPKPSQPSCNTAVTLAESRARRKGPATNNRTSFMSAPWTSMKGRVSIRCHTVPARHT